MELITLHRRAVEQWAASVAAVKNDQWVDPTPCTEWSVRALETSQRQPCQHRRARGLAGVDEDSPFGALAPRSGHARATGAMMVVSVSVAPRKLLGASEPVCQHGGWRAPTGTVDCCLRARVPDFEFSCPPRDGYLRCP